MKFKTYESWEETANSKGKHKRAKVCMFLLYQPLVLLLFGATPTFLKGELRVGLWGRYFHTHTHKASRSKQTTTKAFQCDQTGRRKVFASSKQCVCVCVREREQARILRARCQLFKHQPCWAKMTAGMGLPDACDVMVMAFPPFVRVSLGNTPIACERASVSE